MSKKKKATTSATPTPVSLSPDLEKRTRDFILSIKVTDQGPDKSALDSFVLLGNSQEGYLSLYGEEAEAYYDCVRAIARELCQSELLSANAIGELFNAAILETLDIKSERADLSFEERLDSAIVNFKDALRSGLQEFTIYYPVFGLKIDGLPFSMGNVEFGLFQEGYAADLSLSPDKRLTQSEKDYAQGVLDDFNNMDLWGTPYAKISLRAYDRKAAQRQALREIRACVEILNFYSDLIPYSRGYMYLPGDAGHERIIVASASICDTPKIAISYETAGSFDAISIAALLGAEAKHGLGFSRARSLVSKLRSEYEEKLLTAVRWAGKATVLTYQDRKEDAFLLYMIALETIIAPEKAPEITYRLSLRLAHLMASTAEHRPGIARQVRALYGLRSAIAHSGSFEIKDRDLADIRFITKNCLVHLLRDEPFSQMSTTDDLLKWFDDQVFGST